MTDYPDACRHIDVQRVSQDGWETDVVLCLDCGKVWTT